MVRLRVPSTEEIKNYCYWRDYTRSLDSAITIGRWYIFMRLSNGGEKPEIVGCQSPARIPLKDVLEMSKYQLDEHKLKIKNDSLEELVETVRDGFRKGEYKA